MSHCKGTPLQGVPPGGIQNRRTDPQTHFRTQKNLKTSQNSLKYVLEHFLDTFGTKKKSKIFDFFDIQIRIQVRPAGRASWPAGRSLYISSKKRDQSYFFQIPRKKNLWAAPTRGIPLEFSALSIRATLSRS